MNYLKLLYMQIILGAWAIVCLELKILIPFPSFTLVKSKQKIFVSVVITSLLSTVCTPIAIMTWLNCFKIFCCVDTKDIVFVWFRFFSLYELFPAFVYANSIGSLDNSLFGVKILIFSPFISSFSSPSSGCIGSKSADSSSPPFVVWADSSSPPFVVSASYYNYIFQETN